MVDSALFAIRELMQDDPKCLLYGQDVGARLGGVFREAATLARDFGDHRLGLEGYDTSCWILLDFGDVVVHLFDDATRDYYALEELWAGAKRVPYEPVVRPLAE